MQETKRPRGRPPTGLKRNKKLTINFTQEEIDFLKAKAKENKKSLPNFILESVKQVF
ncbi:hypothetical protein ACLMK5_01155 [Streptococcus anginosus]|uniref:hypothetical protein n=1 Tax=Streptococcus TaxID=1301 RepID=UPI00086B3AB3|nr:MULTISPECIES: hypothetical protein [Streptococcus]MCW1031236.1 hypothetical protein [Streptococcus anginosus]MCW1067668.1 hypothetical protein [Streptococcus anginosus]QBX31512.1 hypothetical protein Javan64_0050 [Streptococcus phage Javan64]SCQ09193.1 hypothetical protein SABVI_1476 [Streptococcus anginosus]